MFWRFGYLADANWWIYVFPAIIIGFIAQAVIKSRYNKYLKIDNQVGLTGAQVAQRILSKNNLGNVTIYMSQGTLSDHYDPRNNSVNLSPNVYNGTSISSMAIAAHECGHALQHAYGYFPLKIRSALVPVVNFGNMLVWPLMLLGIFIAPILTEVAVLLFAAIVLFQVITLPVELNASRRAVGEISEMTNKSTIRGARKVLSAAAFTYIAATLVSIGQFIRLLIITGHKDNNR